LNPRPKLSDFPFRTPDARAQVAPRIQGPDIAEVIIEDAPEVALEILVVAVARQVHRRAFEKLPDVHCRSLFQHSPSPDARSKAPVRETRANIP